MSLTKHLLEDIQVRILLSEGRKDVIINKIGLPEDIYVWISRNIKKKFQIWVANVIRSYLEHMETRITGDLNSVMNGFIKDGEIDPGHKYFINKVDFVIDKIIKRDQKPDINLRNFDDYQDFLRLINQWPTIKDYYEGATPRPNLKELSWDEAYQKAEEWHDSLKASGLSAKIKDVAPDAEIIKEFEDGYKWVDLHTSKCVKLKSFMGHCANTEADTMLQLISDKGKFKITVAFNYDGTYRQAKGTQNDKPDEKYHKYMHWFFTDGGKYQFKEYESEYKGTNDFTVEDLPEDMREEAVEKYPELANFSAIAKAEALYEDDKKEEALDVLNSYVNENYMRGQMASIIEFGATFDEWITDVTPDHADRIFNENLFNFKHASVKSALFVDHLVEWLSMGGRDTKWLLEKWNEDVDSSEDLKYNDLADIVYSLPKHEGNAVIMNIVKEDPSLYKPDMIYDRKGVIEAVIERKMETDRRFKRAYEKIMDEEGLDYNIYNIEDINTKLSYTTKQFKDFLEDAFGYAGFAWSGGGDSDDSNDSFGLYYVLNVDYYLFDEDPDYVFYDLSTNNIWDRISEAIDSYKRGEYTNSKDSIKVYKELTEYAKKLNPDFHDLSTEHLLLLWFVGADASRNAVERVKKQLMLDGYLKDTDLVVKNPNQKQIEFN